MNDEDRKADTRLPEDAPQPKSGSWNRDRFLQLGSLVLVIALVVIIIWQRDNITLFALWLAKYPGLKYIGIFVISAAASATLIIPIPGLAMTSLIGTLSVSPWDPLWIGISSGLGATLGETTGYLLGYSGRMAIPDTARYEKVVGWMKKWGSLTIFVLALLPNPLFDLAGLAAGALKYPLWKFFLIGAAGRLPKHILFSYLGYWGIRVFPHR
ncbi:MAG: VTT domain-containing protein [Dehalococcoidia bacterium]|nr:VTT domain-containing protein [Dehalococcoidia bacterium]